jgi:hypothetical protein
MSPKLSALRVVLAAMIIGGLWITRCVPVTSLP